MTGRHVLSEHCIRVRAILFIVVRGGKGNRGVGEQREEERGE